MSHSEPAPSIANVIEIAQRGEIDEALSLISGPARRGIPEAMVAQGYFLAMRDQEGDQAASVGSFRQAANAGEPGAHYGLAVAFATGRGVAPDAFVAYIHLLFAGLFQPVPVEFGQGLRAQLSDQEIQVATELAGTMRPVRH